MLSGTNIVKTFNSDTALKGLSVRVTPGEATVIVGPSGAGKSTLLRALALIDPPSSGRVVIDHLTYEFPMPEETTLATPWPTLTVVFQQLFLWPHLRIRDNILLPARGKADTRIRKAFDFLMTKLGIAQLLDGRSDDSSVQHYFDFLVQSLRIGHILDSYPNRISVGEKQRVALARALILRPRYILLDEVTAALDVEQIANVLNLLSDLKRQGLGILCVSHLLGFAMQLADHVVFLEDGSLVEEGGPSLLKSPRTERMKRFISFVEAEPAITQVKVKAG